MSHACLAQGRWLVAHAGDGPVIERHVDIMHQMDWHYHVLTVVQLQSALTRHRGELRYFASDRFELTLFFQFSPRRAAYFLWSVGVLGQVTPARALELVVAEGRRFLRDHGCQSFYAIRPRRMDYPLIQAFHDLVPSHPELRVTSVDESPDSVVWRIEVPGNDGEEQVERTVTCATGLV